jgi:ankyrin repeat protein
MGHRPIAEYMLGHGAPITIFAAAMLGDLGQVRQFLENDPALANARGAHEIPLLFHAALSGEVAVAELLDVWGCTEGHDQALHAAISFGRTEMVGWLLTHGVTDIDVPDFREQKPRQRAVELGHQEIVNLLDGWRNS